VNAFSISQEVPRQLPDLKNCSRKSTPIRKPSIKIREHYSGHRSEKKPNDRTEKRPNTKLMNTRFFYLNGEEVSTLVAKTESSIHQSRRRKTSIRANVSMKFRNSNPKKKRRRKNGKKKGRRRKIATIRESKSFFAFASL